MKSSNSMDRRSHRWPFGHVPVAQFGESAESAQPALGFDSRFGCRGIAPGEEGDDLLDRQCITRESSTAISCPISAAWSTRR